MPCEGDALLFSDREGEVFEDHTGSEFHAKVFDSEHVGGLVESGGILNQKATRKFTWKAAD